jgi:hypothetical protein
MRKIKRILCGALVASTLAFSSCLIFPPSPNARPNAKQNRVERNVPPRNSPSRDLPRENPPMDGRDRR